MKKLILIKYGELTTKGDNRKQFIKLLVKNIKNKLNCFNVEIKYDLSRMKIIVNDDDLIEVKSKLKQIFGLHNIVVCDSTNSTIEDIKDLTLEVLKKLKFSSFKIYTKRSDKTFPKTSIEMNDILGGHVLRNINCKVDVHNPDIIVTVEITRDLTYIYVNEEKGLGGYPVGIQGKGLLMLSGGIDSPVAGYLALKRGVDLECIYFESPPHTSIEAKNKVITLAKKLNEYSGNIKVHIVSFTSIQEEIYKNINEAYMITIMRRMMYRIAEKLAKKRKCKIIINGESIGQVASQTLTSMSVINEVVNIPVIRPVACLDKIEIINIAKTIDTYETSILPYEDCCTIFVPKHPVINPEIGKCIEYERLIDYETLIREAIDNIETINLKEERKFDSLL